LGEYGAAQDKTNSKTEGGVPYAWVFYLEMRGARGSAYSQDTSGLVHAENLAIARSEQARWRAADKVLFNAVPLTSDERLELWREKLGVEQFPEDSRHDLRLRCATKYKAALGPTETNVDQACADLLGSAFVRNWRSVGVDLATPPSITYWPGVNPGPAAFSLGGGAWLSERSHLTVEVQRPSTMSLADFLTLMNVHLFHLLDRLLPMWSTFNWAIGVEDGFLLDISQLDFTGMN
jgi:hypothetical protein